MQKFEFYKRRLKREAAALHQTESGPNSCNEAIQDPAHDQVTTLSDGEEHYRSLVEHSPDAILIECERQIVFANAAAMTLFGARSLSELLGRGMLSLVTPSARSEVAKVIRDLEQHGIIRTAEEQALRINGEVIDVAVTRQPFTYRGRASINMVARDVTDRKAIESRLHFQATHDTLTGLPNRNLLMDRLQGAIADAKRRHGRFVLAFVDLDRFKWINDSLGHDAGDLVLKTVSQRMLDCMRESDTIARIGGDEFVLILPESGDRDESHVLNRMVACVSKPVDIGGHQIVLTCSMGCSAYPRDAQSADSLLRFSDAAMFRAKEMGRNNVQLYNPELRSRIDERAKLRTELGNAIQSDELKLHYQLQVCLKTGAIMGMEALLRWQHPELGNVAPSRFIPIAEETGLIESIGDWVIREACQQSRRWQDAGLMKVRVAVNLSAKQLIYPSLELRVAECLADARLDASCLELELTETASMDDPDKTLLLMYRLKDLGVALSIDDFGTGYSNLHYLQRFPVDKLKLDGSFVREITSDPGSLAIADAIVSVAHRLGMKVVGEMAETESQVAMLARSGCDYVQGYYFCEPLPADECAELLALGRLPVADIRHMSHSMSRSRVL